MDAARRSVIKWAIKTNLWPLAQWSARALCATRKMCAGAPEQPKTIVGSLSGSDAQSGQSGGIVWREKTEVS